MGILTEEMKLLVREQSLGFVATVCPDGTPNLSPKGTTTVWDDDHLVFAEIASPQTIENLRSNPAVEVNVVDPILRKGYRFKGTATIHADGELFERAIVLIHVEQAEALVSPVYSWGQTEEEVSAWWLRYWAERRTEARPHNSQASGGT